MNLAYILGKTQFNMAFYRILILLLICCLGSCKESTSSEKEAIQEIEKLKLALAKSQLDQKGKIAHEVFLDLKPDQDIPNIIKSIQALSKIKEVQALKVGTFKNLDDDRALSEFEIKFQMYFESEEDYKTYQTDSIHLQLKDALKLNLIGPPVTYDFIIR